MDKKHGKHLRALTVTTKNRPLEVVKTRSGFSPMPLGSAKKFVGYELRNSGKTALSLENAMSGFSPMPLVYIRKH